MILQALLITALLQPEEAKAGTPALRKDEAQLQRAADEWKTTFDCIRDLITVMDREFRIVRVNRATVSFCDLPPDRILGNNCDTLVRGTEKPFERSLLEKAQATRRHEEEEIVHKGRDAGFLVSVDPI